MKFTLLEKMNISYLQERPTLGRSLTEEMLNLLIDRIPEAYILVSDHVDGEYDPVEEELDIMTDMWYKISEELPIDNEPPKPDPYLLSLDQHKLRGKVVCTDQYRVPKIGEVVYFDDWRKMRTILNETNEKCWILEVQNINNLPDMPVIREIMAKSIDAGMKEMAVRAIIKYTQDKTHRCYIGKDRKNLNLENIFTWHRSDEGQEFWSNIHMSQ